MRALVNYERAPFKVELREKPVPEIGDEDVLLAVKGVGVCGSDLHQWHASHSWPVHYPVTLGHEFGGVGNKTLKPSQLVIEFRSWLRISIGEVDGSDQDSFNSRFNIASLMILGVSRQACAGQHGKVVSRENGHAVPGTLPLPNCFIPNVSKGRHRKGTLLHLQLLETNDVRLRFR